MSVREDIASNIKTVIDAISSPDIRLCTRQPFELEEFHSFSSINVRSSYCSIASISCTDDAHKLTQKIRSKGSEKAVTSIYKIFRDYGLKDREQAPG